jgi:uncharacterized ubiquitin-like protein YukD
VPRKWPLNFESDVKVLDVKNALQEKEGIQVDQIRLIFSGKQLADDRALEEYGVTAGAVIHLVLAMNGPPARSARMQIWMKTLTGRKSPFNFKNYVKVLDVKNALQEKESIQVDQIRLIFSGKQLADDKALEYYGVAAGDVIHMVLQLRGGATAR